MFYAQCMDLRKLFFSSSNFPDENEYLLNFPYVMYELCSNPDRRTSEVTYRIQVRTNKQQYDNITAKISCKFNNKMSFISLDKK